MTSLSLLAGRTVATIMFNSFHASGNCCRLLITFANSLDPDQDLQNVGPDKDSNLLAF